MNPLEALNRELERHRSAHDPASARAEIVRMFQNIWLNLEASEDRLADAMAELADSDSGESQILEGNDLRAEVVARLENMQKNGNHWLTVTAVLALLNDCNMRAASERA